VKNALALPIALAIAAAAPVSAQPAPPFVINAIVSMTGPSANLGQDAAASLAALEKLVNRTGGIKGRQLHFQIGDDQSSPAVAAQLFQQLLPSHPAVVLGSTTSAPSQAMAADVTADGPVLYALTPNLLPKPGGFVFAAGVKTIDIKRVEVTYYRMRGFTKIGVIATTDASGQNNLAGIQEILRLPENKDVKLADVESFGLSDVSMAAQATRLKAAGVQMIFDYSEGTAFLTSLHALNDTGLAVTVNTPGANFSPSLLNQVKSILPKELDGTGQSFVNRNRSANDPQKKPIDDFYASLAADGVTAPTGTNAYAWDPALIVVSVLRSLGTNATAAQIHTAIENLRDFPGAGGIYDFSSGDQHGATVRSILVVRNDPDHPGNTKIVSKQGGAPL
jgi:branched-chain amino acid transport system substrate-binding protein